MPNIAGWVPHPENPEAGAFKFDDGTQSSWMIDPNGNVRAEAEDIAAKLMTPPPTPVAPTPTAPPPLAPAPAPLSVQPPTAPAPAPAPVAAPPPAPAAIQAVPSLPPVPVPSAVQAPAAHPAPVPAKGLVQSGQGITQARSETGIVGEDREKIEAANTEAQQKTEEADIEAIRARTAQLNADWERLTSDEKSKLAEQDVQKEREKKFTALFEAKQKANEEIAARPVSGATAMGSEAKFYAFMAAFGDAVQNFGANLMGRAGNANPGATVDRIVQSAIQSQMAQKEAEFKAGQITANQLEAERERIRMNITTLGEQMAKIRLDKAKTEGEKLGLGAMVKKFAAERADSSAKNATALARQETTQETIASEYAQPKPMGPGKWAPTDQESQALSALLGPKWEESFEKGMNSKVVAGENGASVQQAIPMIHEMDQDIATLKSLAAANGGTIPTKGLIKVPEALRGVSARMGLKDGMAAEEANQLMHGYVLKKARSYGGAVTEPDFENASKEFGTSGDGFLRGVERMRGAVANGTRQALVTHFRGHAQPVLQIAMGAYAKAPGVVAPKTAEEFEVTSAAHPDEGKRELSDIEKKQAENREGLKRKVAESLPTIKLPRSGPRF